MVEILYLNFVPRDLYMAPYLWGIALCPIFLDSAGVDWKGPDSKISGVGKMIKIVVKCYVCTLTKKKKHWYPFK